jgi:hypothetical protein
LIKIKAGIADWGDDLINDQDLVQNIEDSLALLKSFEANRARVQNLKKLINEFKEVKVEAKTLFVTFMHKK